MPGWRRPAPHAGKTLLRLIVGGTRVGTPNPTRCRRPAPRFSYDHDGMLRTATARPARSRRNADQVLEVVVDVPDRRRLRERHASRYVDYHYRSSRPS
ncbi:MAG: hypothetical protein ABW292_15640 [Vicinamibacterales bacterium]